MKILDIISERAVVPPGSLAARAAARNASTAAPAAAASSAKSMNFFQRVQARAATSKAKAPDIIDKWQGTIGFWAKVLWVLGVLDSAGTLVWNLHNAEEEYKNDPTITEEDFKHYRELYFGQFTAAILLPALASRLRIASVVNAVVRVIVSVVTGGGAVAATVGSGGLAAAPAIAGFFAEQAFFTALSVWLGSAAAQEWIAGHLVKPLIYVGYVPEAIWSELYKQVTGTDVYKDAAEKKAAATKDKAAKGDPAAQSQIASTSAAAAADANQVKVAGMVITNADGTPNMNAINSYPVQQVIQNYPDAKQKVDAVLARGQSKSQSTTPPESSSSYSNLSNPYY
jgi:hypothetical protein